MASSWRLTDNEVARIALCLREYIDNAPWADMYSNKEEEAEIDKEYESLKNLLKRFEDAHKNSPDRNTPRKE